MSENYAIIGGDLRIVRLSKMLAQDQNNVFCYGIEQSEELQNTKNLYFSNSLKEAIKNAQIIIAPVPFSSNGEEINTPFSKNIITIKELMHEINTKTLIAGNIPSNVYEIANGKNIKIIDIMKQEELAILNTIATAEGAISEAILNTDQILHNSNVLILGFGRIGKILARKLDGLSAIVTCTARKNEDFAWIKSYGYKQTNINELGENLKAYDIIINTVPKLILKGEQLKNVKKDCLLIDLASNPGGIDKKIAKNMGLKLVCALALPGKVAPTTSAEFIKNTIYNVLKEV